MHISDFTIFLHQIKCSIAAVHGRYGRNILCEKLNFSVVFDIHICAESSEKPGLCIQCGAPPRPMPFGFLSFAPVSALPVIGVLAVLSEIVLVEKLLLHPSGRGIYHHRVPVHECDLLHHDGVVHGVHCVLAPCKGAVGVHRHARYVRRRLPSEGLDYDAPGLLFILPTISCGVILRVQGMSP